MLRELTCYESSRCSGAVGSTNCTLADMRVTFNSSAAYSFKLCGTAYRGILESRESCDDSCCSISSSGCWLYGDVMVPYHMALELLPSVEERWRAVRGAYYGYYYSDPDDLIAHITYDSPLHKVCDYQCVPQF